jgi:acetylornithine aminotransferase
MAQIGESPAGRVGLPLHVPVDFIPFYDPDRPAESIADAIDTLRKNLERYPGAYACFYTELLQGEGGFREAPRDYFVPLFDICRENNVGIWIDEIQTFGRTEQMFHFQHKDLGNYADVVTLGKMSQVCACLYTKDYNPKPGLLSATFVGSTVGLAVGKRMVERLRDGEYFGAGGRNARLQKAFRVHAKRLVDRHPDWFPAIDHPRGGKRKALGFFGGVGGMMRLTPFAGQKDMIMKSVRTLFEEGVVTFYCGHDPYHLRFLAPVGVMEEAQLEPVFEIVERALTRVATEG